MKKKLVILLVIGIVISIFVTCFPTEHYLIKDFDFYGAELQNPNETIDENKEFRNVIDTLKNKLYFSIEAHGEFQYTASIDNISLINQCYATSRPVSLDNDILLDELELRLSLDIYFESEVIEKGTDLWNHPKLKDYRWFYKRENKDPTSFYGVIGFIDTFYEKVLIPQKDYSIELICKTSDNHTISKSNKLYLKL